MSKNKLGYNYNLGIGVPVFDFKDKDVAVRLFVSEMLNRTARMFKYTGLPDTIPQRMVELYLQTNGNVCFYQHQGDLYVYTGGLGGTPNEYYMPTIYTIANPAQQLTVNAEINKDCIVIPNDTLYIGLIPLCSKYATLMAENELSIRLGIVNTRIVSLISAGDDRTKASAEKYLKDIEDGKQGIIGSMDIFDGASIKAQPYGATSGTNLLTNLIEMQQYLKASFFNELGLNANYNMKRESLNSAESALNDDMLLPLVDDMLRCRKDGLEKVNAMFGTHITVEFDSAWLGNQEEQEAAHDQMDEEQIEEEGGDDPNDTESDDSDMDDSGDISDAGDDDGDNAAVGERQRNHE